MRKEKGWFGGELPYRKIIRLVTPNNPIDSNTLRIYRLVLRFLIFSERYRRGRKLAPYTMYWPKKDSHGKNELQRYFVGGPD